MRRRKFITLASTAAAVQPFIAAAQQAVTSARIGYLCLDRMNVDPHCREAFLRSIRDIGYVEGENLAIEYRDALGKPERLSALAAELAGLKVDVIVAGGGAAGVLAAKGATTTIPIVFPGEPISEGLVASLVRPGDKITGIPLSSTHLEVELVSLLHEAIPSARRVVMPLVIRVGLDHGPELRAVRTAASREGIDLVEAFGFQPNASAVRGAKPEAVLIGGLAPFYSNAEHPFQALLEAGLPTICQFPDAAHDGCLLGYGPDFAELGRQVADLVARILQGASPADLPAEAPKKLKLVVNLKTARALGLTVPPTLLARADEVIE